MIASYLRVSTALQAEANGVDAQRHAIDQWLSANGLRGAVEYADEAYSGKNTDRPAWQRLMGDIEAGRVDTVVAYDLSRCGRSFADMVAWLQRMQGANVRVVFVRQALDLSTSTGRLMAHLLASIAEWQREEIAHRIRDGVRARIAGGAKWGGARVKHGENGARGGWKLSDQDKAEVVAARARGVTVRELAGRLGVSEGTIKRVARQAAKR
jgi:site-specific DNA recombinase